MTIAADRWLASPAAGGRRDGWEGPGSQAPPQHVVFAVRTFPPARPRYARREPVDQREEVS